MSAVKMYTYDGSFHGFMGTACAILRSEHAAFRISVEKESGQKGLFENTGTESTPTDASKGLWESLRQKGLHVQRLIYFAFLSEEKDCDQVLAEYLCLMFGKSLTPEKDRAVLQRKITSWARAVEAEKTELENALLFVSAGGDTPECHIAPKHNVLPLLSRHFRIRYGKGSWLIVDRKRNFALFGHEGTVRIVPGGWNRLRHVPINKGKLKTREGQRVRPAI